MSAAVANDAAPASSPPPAPGPELAQSDLAAVKPLMYLCLASLCAGGVSAVAAALTLGFRPAPAVVASLSLGWARDASKVSAALARGYHPAPVFKHFITAALGSSLVSSVLFLAVLSLLLRAALRGVDSMAKLIKACGQPTLKRMLGDIVVPEYLSSLFFVVLFTVGCLRVVEMSKQPPPPRPRGFSAVIVMPFMIAGFTATISFLVIPSMLLKLWRTKLGGAAAAGSTV